MPSILVVRYFGFLSRASSSQYFNSRSSARSSRFYAVIISAFVALLAVVVSAFVAFVGATLALIGIFTGSIVALALAFTAFIAFAAIVEFVRFIAILAPRIAAVRRHSFLLRPFSFSDGRVDPRRKHSSPRPLEPRDIVVEHRGARRRNRIGANPRPV